MKRGVVLRWALVIAVFVVSVFVALQFQRVAHAEVRKFENMNIEDQAAAIMYSQMLSRCATDRDDIGYGGMAGTIDINATGRSTYKYVFEADTNHTDHPVSFLVNAHDGKATCGEVSGGESGGLATNTMRGGNAFEFFGLNELDPPEVLLTEVFGYTQDTAVIGGAQTWTIKATGVEYFDDYVTGARRADGTVTRTITTPIDVGNSAMIFGTKNDNNYLGCDFCHWYTFFRLENSYTYGDPTLEGDETVDEVENEFRNFLVGRTGLASYQTSSFSQARQLYFQDAGAIVLSDDQLSWVWVETGEPFVNPTGLIVDGGYRYVPDVGSGNPVLSDSASIEVTLGSSNQESTTYNAPGDPSANFNRYAAENIFGRGAENAYIDMTTYPKVGYYYYYSQLISDQTCSAKIVEKEDPEGRARYSSENAYYTGVTVVSGNARKDMYADWSDQTKEYEYTSIAPMSGDIPVGGLYGYTNSDTYVDCAEIAARVSYLASMLSDEDLADPAIQVGAESIYDPNYDPDDEDILSGEEEDDPCYRESGTMGWVLCSAIVGLGEFMSGVYQNTVQPMLKIDASLLTQETNNEVVNGTYQAWTVFQGIANVAFIIMLLVVIFSQLTGLGIDNYGIKKIMPKLIITAVLVNLSFIICQLLVDLSNLLGFAINDLFTRIGDSVTISIPEEILGGQAVPTEGFNTATLVAGLALGLAAFASVLVIGGGGWAIVIPILFTLLTGALAVFFIFVLLGVRKAGVVILVAISPLAFVCYMLPNTKKLFDKWLKMLQGLLMMFPLCGLLIGGGYLAARILLASGGTDFFIRLIALLLLVVPFFFLPMLLKGSFAAMGNIGAKISGFGRGMGKQVVGRGRPALEKSRLGQRMTRGRDYRAYRKAEAGKARQSEFQRRKAEGVVSKYGGGDFDKLSAGQKLALTGARQTISAHDAQQTKMYADSFADMGTDTDVRAGLDAAIADGNENMMAAAIENLAARSDFGTITTALQNTDLSKMSDSMRTRLSNSLITHKKDSAQLWGWAKQMKANPGYNSTLAQYVSSGDMANDMAKEGDDLMTTQDASSLKALNALTGGNAAKAFSDKQITHAAGNLDKADSVKHFNKMFAGMGEDRVREIISGMSAAQVAKLKGSTMDEIGGAEKLKSMVQPDVLKQLANEQNATLVAGMNNDVRRALLGDAAAPGNNPGGTPSNSGGGSSNPGSPSNLGGAGSLGGGGGAGGANNPVGGGSAVDDLIELTYGHNPTGGNGPTVEGPTMDVPHQTA